MPSDTSSIIQMHNQFFDLEIDHESCSGSGYCASICPEVFEVHDEKAWILDNIEWDKVDLSAVQDACNACPWVAIACKAK